MKLKNWEHCNLGWNQTLTLCHICMYFNGSIYLVVCSHMKAEDEISQCVFWVQTEQKAGQFVNWPDMHLVAHIPPHRMGFKYNFIKTCLMDMAEYQIRIHMESNINYIRRMVLEMFKPVYRQPNTIWQVNDWMMSADFNYFRVNNMCNLGTYALFNIFGAKLQHFFITNLNLKAWEYYERITYITN